jgi:hypothetical protein
MSVVRVVYCQIDACSVDRSLSQVSPTDCSVSGSDSQT